jgi:hypothetical protein
MDNPNVFEVQTLKDGRWMIEQRCRNEQEAVAEARDLFETRHFQSVKVVKELFDQAAKLYRETTIFSLPDGNGADVGGPMVRETKMATPPPRQAKRKVAKPKKRSLLDFFRE